MALTERYVDPSLAADSGTGTRATITCSAATFTIGTLNLNETAAFASYTFASGDEIYITGGTAVNAGYYTIASKTDADNIVLTADITSDASSPTDVTAATAPYGDLEYAIEQTTFDTTNGTRVNIKAGTDEVLAASLEAAFADTSVSVAWVPTRTAPCILEGYTTASNDGGIGGISGGGSVAVIDGSTFDFVNFVNLHLHNTGAVDVIDIDNNCSVINCEVDNTTANGIRVDSNSTVIGCHIHNIGDRGIEMLSGLAAFNFIEDGTNTLNFGIDCLGPSTILRNIIQVSGAGIGIDSWTDCIIENNSIYSAAGSGSGIRMSNSLQVISVMNNLVEGFTTGVGYDLDGTTTLLQSYGGNASYNNGTHYQAPVVVTYDFGDNETLSASPFTSASTDDFSPVDTGNVKQGGLPADFGNGAI